MFKEMATRSDDLYATVSYCGGGGGGGGGGSRSTGNNLGVCTADDPNGDGIPGSGQGWADSFEACMNTVVGDTLGTGAGDPRNAEAVSQAGIVCAAVAAYDNW